MRWYVDLSSIGTDSPANRYCVEADGWQRALQQVRAQRGDDGPLGNFSIELLDDGYRAIDPLTRTRFVVIRAADDAVLSGPVAATPAGSVKVPATQASEQIPTPRESARSNGVPAARSSNRGRASERGARARPQATPSPVIPNDPVARPSTESPARSTPDPNPRPVEPLVPARPMQAETAFERMTGGIAVPLPDDPPSRADVPTQVLSAFKVVSRRSEDPTPSSPLTYRELSISVPEGTSLADAEAIASAQLMMIRNAVSGAPKGQFIQLAIFDYEYTAKPSKGPPIVTLTFKDWRGAEPELRYPKRDGVATSGPSSLPPRMMASEPPKAASKAPSAPPTAPVEELPTTVVQVSAPADAPVPSVAAPSVAAPSAAAPSVAVPSVTPSTTRSGESSVLAKQMMGIEPDATTASPEAVEVIRAVPIVSVERSNSTPEPPPVEATFFAAPVVEPNSSASVTAPSSSAAPEPSSSAVPTEEAPKSPSIPPPSPSVLRRDAAAMAGDDDLTLVKDSNPPPALAAGIVDIVIPRATKTERIAVQPVGATLASGTPASAALAQAIAAIPPSKPPPAATPASTPPPGGKAIPSSAPPAGSSQAPPTQSDGTASWVAPRTESAPPASRPFVPGVVVRTPKPRRKAGDELIADLFEACSDLAFVQDPLEGAEFVADLVMDSVPCLAVLVSFFDINTREFVVVRQIVARGEGESLPNVVLTRASEHSQNLAKTMRSGRALLFTESECANLGDARWDALGVKPASLGSAPVKFGGRYLGLIELCNPLDGRALTEGDGHALTYIGEQYGEFLSERELSVDPEYVKRPKLSQIARR